MTNTAEDMRTDILLALEKARAKIDEEYSCFCHDREYFSGLETAQDIIFNLIYDAIGREDK